MIKFFLIGCLFFNLFAPAAYGREYSSRFSIKIELEKETFKFGEPITGEIIISHTYPANLPATFDVWLYNETDKFHSLTSIRAIPTGKTSFSLENFGIMALTTNLSSLGKWHLSVGQHNADPTQAAEVSFFVIE